MNRPDNWEYGAWQKDECLLRSPPINTEERLYNAYEAGADTMQKAIRDAYPTSHEVRLRIIDMVYGGLSVPEFEAWLKEKLLIK